MPSERCPKDCSFDKRPTPLCSHAWHDSREGGLPRDPFSGLPRMPAEIEDALRESCTCDGYNHRCAYISTKLRAAIQAELRAEYLRGRDSILDRKRP